MSLTVEEYTELRFITDLLATAPASWENMISRRLLDVPTPAVLAALAVIQTAAKASTAAAPADKLLDAARKLSEDADELRRDAGLALFGALADHRHVPDLASAIPRQPRLRPKTSKARS